MTFVSLKFNIYSATKLTCNWHRRIKIYICGIFACSCMTYIQKMCKFTSIYAKFSFWTSLDRVKWHVQERKMFHSKIEMTYLYSWWISHLWILRLQQEESGVAQFWKRSNLKLIELYVKQHLMENLILCSHSNTVELRVQRRFASDFKLSFNFIIVKYFSKCETLSLYFAIVLWTHSTCSLLPSSSWIFQLKNNSSAVSYKCARLFFLLLYLSRTRSIISSLFKVVHCIR